MNEPRTDQEWQQAADGSHGVLVIEAARRLGLITGADGTVNAERAADVLRRAKERGIKPRPFALGDTLEAFGIVDHKVQALLGVMEQEHPEVLALAFAPMLVDAVEHFMALLHSGEEA